MKDEIKTGKGWLGIVKSIPPDVSYDRDLTLEDLTNTLMEIFYNKPKEETRKVVGFRGCLTKGWVDIGEMFHCGNIECPSCNLMDKLLREEAENFLKESSNDK
jgi:hypothetical protein